jgi:hypothetical protein
MKNSNKRKISFFVKPYWFFNLFFEDKTHMSIPGSSAIRGEQMAQYLGAKYNPSEDDCKNDIRIYVKPTELESIKRDSYIDVVDGEFLVEELKNRPDLKVIACSKVSYEYLTHKLKNKLFLIPQHHCNFERFKRQRREVNTVGAIGIPIGFDKPDIESQIIKKLTDNRLVYKNECTYQSREDIVNFYKDIDIQIVWIDGNKPLKNPLRIVNAASFGIPTVAHRQIGYKEFEGNYIGVETIDDLIDEVKKLRDDKDYYNYWSAKIIKPAEEYHINKIAKLYKQLK